MKSLAGRVFLILVVATVLIQVLSFGGALAVSARDSRRQMFEFMGADVAFLHQLLGRMPPAERAQWMPALDRGFYQPALEPAGVVHPEADTPHLRESMAPMRRRLDPAIDVRGVMLDPPAPGEDGIPALAVSLDAAHTLLVRFPTRKAPLAPPPLGVIAGYVAGVSLAVMLAAWGAVRLATRPLRRLAEAAHALGHNLDAPALPERGASELVEASRAFNVMQAALQKNLAERTQILAAISHDLKTPLTRLRLRIGALPADEQARARIETDIDAMSQLVEEGLDYARSAQPVEATARVDLQALVESLADQAADLGQVLRIEGRLAAPVRCAPRAVRRALQNLVDNALKYGGGAATLQLAQDEGGVEIRIEDDGPGLPPALLERVFEPFFRAEDSRSRKTGGTGLGLAIARNLMRAQGGDIRLENRTGGGLVAILHLPRG